MTVALATRIHEVVGQLKDGEQEAALVILERMLNGQAAYGPIDIDHDNRDWNEETFEEACDELVYRAFRALAVARARRLAARRQDLHGFHVRLEVPSNANGDALARFVDELHERGSTEVTFTRRPW